MVERHSCKQLHGCLLLYKYIQKPVPVGAGTGM
nr:MAG TPA: receptor tyrosine kinase [Caudoviricetes sp.]